MAERVFLRIERPDPALILRYGKLSVSTVYESMGVTLGRAQLMDAGLRPVIQGSMIVGPAITAQCHSGDNSMSHVAITLCQPGDVLVVAGGDPITALWGDMTSLAAKTRGAAGVILDGGVRDVGPIRAMGFPVWARTVSPAKPVKATVGSANVPVRAAGVLVQPGDLVLADDDGVVVVPKAALVEVLERAEQREATEEARRGVVLGGDTELSYRQLGIEKLLREQGVEIVEGTYDDWLRRDA